jgi:hypothetical protein
VLFLFLLYTGGDQGNESGSKCLESIMIHLSISVIVRVYDMLEGYDLNNTIEGNTPFQ